MFYKFNRFYSSKDENKCPNIFLLQYLVKTAHVVRNTGVTEG